jgi:hypothetical protein
VAVDGAGDVFIADSGNSRVVEVPAGGGAQTTVGSGLSYPFGVAVDEAGDVFIVDSDNNRVVEVPAGCASAACQTTVVSGLFSPFGVAVDRTGDVFIADMSNNQVVEVQRSRAPTLSFAATAVGYTSTDSPQSVTAQNIGNQVLDAVSPGLSIGATSFVQVAGSGAPADCTSSFSLAPGASCNLSLSFIPQKTGSIVSAATFTDNALNATTATQSVSLSGKGTPAPLTITASSGTMMYGGTVPTITPIYSGFVNGDTPSSLTTQPTCTTTATSHSPAGSYPSSCTGAVDSNYTISYVNGKVTVDNPLPTATKLSPASATAGGVAFTLTVTGTNFVSSSAVEWKGKELKTTYVSGVKLTASVPAGDIATGGTPSVTVMNPTPGGGASSALTFTIDNPLPTASSLSPASATEGGAAFTLTVTGTNFVSSSAVEWKGKELKTTYVSGTKLTAPVPAGDIAKTGTASVTVMNPTPGGGASSALTFTIDNPLPTATKLSPASATAGGAAFTLTVTGTNFISSSAVEWKGKELKTTYVNSTKLTASVPASDIAAGGTPSVTVMNPTPGGGTSNGLTFTINNLAPTLASLSPSSAAAGGAAFTLTVTGTNFVSTSAVEWKGKELKTTYVSGKKLTASVPASDIATAGKATVTVMNPTPGGGTSSGLTFTIR